jgi:alkylation response protein AidB-like acyl-CoA dehydrogenase
MSGPVDPLAAVEALAPMISARAEEVEAARRLPRDIAEAMIAAKLFKLCVPKAYGGLEAEPAVLLAAIRAMAQADASAGWCLMIGATSGMSAAYLEPDAARLIHGDPSTVTGGIFAPRGKAVREGDVYRVNGRWQWASGNSHCRWMKGGCLVFEEGMPKLSANGAPEMRMVYMPTDALQFVDNWHVSGLSGSGSCDMVATDVTVPVSHSVSLTSDRPRVEGALYRFPAFGLLALGCAAVALGVARGALEDIVALASLKKPTLSQRSLAERPATQAEVARTEAMLRSAGAFVDQAVAQAWTQAKRGQDLDVSARAALRLAATHATETAAKVVTSCYSLGGGTSVYRDSPLQRRFRDVHVVTQHMMVAPPTYELVGRALLGLPTDPTMM